MNKYSFFLTLILFSSLILISSSTVFALDYEDINSPALRTDKHYVVNFPAGTVLRGIVQHKISSTYNQLQDVVYVIISEDLKYEHVTCIPKSTKLIGKISKIGKAQLGQNGYFQIRFETLKYPSGKEIDILGHIWTSKENGIIGGEYTERIGYKRIPHYIEGIGAVLQLRPYGPRKMGKETEVLPGTEWVIILDKELKLTLSED